MPALGLVSLAISFFLCAVLIPEDCQPEGALRLPATVLAIGLLLPMTVATLSAPRSLFHAQNIVAASPVYWLLLDMIQGSYPLASVTASDCLNSLLAISLFAAGVWCANTIRPLNPPSALVPGLRSQFSTDQLFYVACLAFALAFLRFAIPAKFDIGEIAASYTRGRWEAAWSRGAMGGWDAFLDHFAYFGYILPVLGVLIARRAGWLNYRTVIVLGLTTIIGALLSVGGGRRIIGVMAGSGMTVWFLTAPVLRLRSLLLFVLGSASLLLFMQIMLLYRNDGLSNIFSGDLSARMASQRTLHIDDNFLRLTQLTQIIPESHPHTTWRYLLWVAVRPVPRVFWPGKPLDPGFDLPRYLGRTDVSFSASTIGELYMAFGFFGCAFGGLFYGWLANSLVAVFNRFQGRIGATITYGVGTLALFAGMRSGIDLVLMSYGIAGWFVVVTLYFQLTQLPKD